MYHRVLWFIDIYYQKIDIEFRNRGSQVKRPIPYGIMNYAELVRDNAYFVDKTRFIAKLEEIHNPVFLRPRRFGKSLFCSMLHYYYDRAQEKRFEELFGHTWIGKNPTARHNQFIVFKGDFSEIGVHQQITESGTKIGYSSVKRIVHMAREASMDHESV